MSSASRSEQTEQGTAADRSKQPAMHRIYDEWEEWSTADLGRLAHDRGIALDGNASRDQLVNALRAAGCTPGVC